MNSFMMDDNQVEQIYDMTPEFPMTVHLINMKALDIPWHWHEEVEFKYVETGSLRIRTEKEEFILQPGEVCFTNTNVMEMSEAVDKTKDTHVIAVLFHPELIGGHFQSIYERKYIKPVLTNRQAKMIKITSATESGGKICRGVKKVRNLYEQKNTEFEIRNVLSGMWLELISEIRTQLSSRPAETVRSKDRIRYMLQFISQHYPEKLSLEDIAESANISEREALRTFRKEIGKAPFDYLNEFRLSKARDLLEGTDLPVTQIAVDTGFSDSAYFSRVFRKYFDCTPGAYRKQMAQRKAEGFPET